MRRAVHARGVDEDVHRPQALLGLEGGHASLATRGRATHDGDRGTRSAEAVADRPAEDAGSVDDRGDAAGQIEEVHRALLIAFRIVSQRSEIEAHHRVPPLTVSPLTGPPCRLRAGRY